LDLKLENKIVIVTGGTGNIGEYICKAFLEEKAIVVCAYLNKIVKIKQIQKWMEEKGIQAENLLPVRADLTLPEEAETIIAGALNSFGKIDVLVNCAGTLKEINFLMMEEEDFEKVWTINFASLARFTKLALPSMMQARSGSIINISSVLGTRFGRGAIAYAASKAAVDRFTQSLALEVGKKGVRVNAVCPGIINIGMATKIIRSKGDNILDSTPLKRYGKANDVAKAVLFLASEETASFITGHKLFVDGGISL